MFKIIFKVEGGEDVTVFAVGGENALELARSAGVPIDAPCSGNGTCGKCRVKVLDEKNASNFSCVNAIHDVWQLACESVISGDITFLVPGITASYINNISVEDYKKQGKQGDGSAVLYGLAIDIGTTTVSVLLVDLSTGDILAKATTGNAQIRYGADVINRIIEQQKPGGIKKLQDAIVKETLILLIDELCAKTGVLKDKITRLTVAANTTMNHLFLGIDANSIRIEPYEPTFLEFEVYDPASIGINVAPDAEMFLAPNIGSYVGGDITAGVMVAGVPSGWPMWKLPGMEMSHIIGQDDNGAPIFEEFEIPPRTTLFIDLGTNGEIVLGTNEFMMACACSAGPAFEGGDISCGMRATEGAIEKFSIHKSTMEPEFTVIGNVKPVGLCGSGLIDVVAELFRSGIINGKGKITCASERICYDEYGTGRYIIVFASDSASGIDIALTESDIDNFIRAKGAIFSGIMSLLNPLGFTPADIDDVLIAGGIGSGINIKNAISIGMLPDLPEEKYSYIGNSSLDGAYAMLIVPEGDEVIEEIARGMTYIDLSTQPGYMDEFIAACFLPHTDETLFPSVRT